MDCKTLLVLSLVWLAGACGPMPAMAEDGFAPHPELAFSGRGVFTYEMDITTLPLAVEIWNQAMGFEVISLGSTGAEEDIEVSTSDLIPPQFAAWAKWRFPECWIEVQPYMVDNLPVMVHEVGHCLGLGHSHDIHSIMYPQLQSGEYGLEQTITVEDVAELKEIWYELPNTN